MGTMNVMYALKNGDAAVNAVAFDLLLSRQIIEGCTVLRGLVPNDRPTIDIITFLPAHEFAIQIPSCMMVCILDYKSQLHSMLCLWMTSLAPSKAQGWGL